MARQSIGLIMLYVQNHSTNAYFNAALEQYLLHEFDQDIFMLWRNENAVVMGKHQVAYKEVNYPYVKENGVQVVRRITGGGTVYHDLGNINFTFIERIEDRTKLIDFRRYLEPMRDAFARMGVQLEITKTNDLTLQGKKISGNAEHVFSQQKKVIHHGTILFNSNLQHLGKAIKPGKGVFESKGVNSNRSTVTNVKDALPQDVDIQLFMDELRDEVLRGKEYSIHQLSKQDIESVSALQAEKFDHWKWNYGYSPAYSFTRSDVFNSLGLEVHLAVKNERFTSFKFVQQGQQIPCEFMLDIRHEWNEVLACKNQLEERLNMELDEDLLLHLFN